MKMHAEVFALLEVNVCLALLKKMNKMSVESSAENLQNRLIMLSISGFHNRLLTMTLTVCNQCHVSVTRVSIIVMTDRMTPSIL